MSSPSQPQTTTTISKTELPQYIQDASKANISKANEIAAKPWETYSGEITAPWTPMMNQAADATSNMAFQYQPKVDAANAGLTNAMGVQSGIANRQGPGDLSAYIDPNMSFLMDAINRNGAIARTGIDRTAARRGAYGSDAHGVLEAGQREGETRQVGQLASDVWGRALSASQAHDNTALAGAAGLTSSANSLNQLAVNEQNMGYRDINALMGVGSQQRADTQALINKAISDYYEKRDWDVRGLNIATSALAATPYESTRTTEATSPYYGQSTGGKALGGAVAGGGLGFQVGGPWGAAAGAGLGALAGFF